MTETGQATAAFWKNCESITLQQYTDCFWNAFSTLRASADTESLAREMWLALKDTVPPQEDGEKVQLRSYRPPEHNSTTLSLSLSHSTAHISKQMIADHLRTHGRNPHVDWIMAHARRGQALRLYTLSLSLSSKALSGTSQHFGIFFDNDNDNIFTPSTLRPKMWNSGISERDSCLKRGKMRSWPVEVQSIGDGNDGTVVDDDDDDDDDDVPSRSIAISDVSKGASRRHDARQVQGLWDLAAVAGEYFFLL